MKQRFKFLLLLLPFIYGVGNAQNNIKIQTASSNISSKQLNTAVMKFKMSPSNSQNPQFSDDYCLSNKLTEKHLQERGIVIDKEAYRLKIQEMVANWAGKQKMVSGPIPIIFHVVYNNSTENVSNATIMNIFNTINEDFQLQNSDAVTSHTTTYGFTASNPDISFCLAQQDPLGNQLAEPGVERISSAETFFDSDNG